MLRNENYVCESCGKGVQYVNLVSHAKNRVNSVRKPNLRTVKVLEGGKVVSKRLCMKCLKKAVRPHKVKMEVEKLKAEKMKAEKMKEVKKVVVKAKKESVKKLAVKVVKSKKVVKAKKGEK